MKLPGKTSIYLLVYSTKVSSTFMWCSCRLLVGCRIVESVGEGVVDMRKGDHVIPIFNGECGDCVYCKCDKTNLCERFRVHPLRSVMVNDGNCRFSTKDGKPIFHFLNTSTFTEYTVLHSACVVKIDSKAPLKKMILLSCGVSSGNQRFSN